MSGSYEYGFHDLHTDMQVTNRTLPAYLRGAGLPDLAVVIETAEPEPEAQAEALGEVQAELDEGTEEYEVISRMLNALRTALDAEGGIG